MWIFATTKSHASPCTKPTAARDGRSDLSRAAQRRVQHAGLSSATLGASGSIAAGSEVGYCAP